MRVVMEYAHCREKAQGCLDEAQRSDITEEQRKLFLWMAGQWQALASEMEIVGLGREPVTRA